MEKIKTKSKTFIIILIIITILLFIFSFYLFKKSLTKYDDNSLKYNENSNIEYKVYLKENKFFEEKYLEMNQVYITSLIDYIDIDFNYDFILNQKKNGNYKYYITGIISANTQNSQSNYWKKEYQLSTMKEEEFNNINVLNIYENIKIDYQKYNDLLLSFKKEYGLSLDATFNVYLNIDINIDEENKIANCFLAIPLTKATIEVPIEINNINNAGTLINEEIKNNTPYKISSIILFIISLINSVYITFTLVKKEEKKYDYNKRIKRILKTYDEIIVNATSEIPKDKYHVIKLSNFNELLDAHSEVRLPITFYENKSEAEFSLINDNILWLYIINKENYEKE